MDSSTHLSTAPKFFCFVLMPFDKEYDDGYEIGIKEACANAGAYCERVDEQIFQGGILERIYNQISKADLIIAEMTGRNPNVFYEVGYAHALGKPAVLITKNAEDIPFDLKAYPHIVYEGVIVRLREELARRVRWHIEQKVAGVFRRQAVAVFQDGKQLSPDAPNAMRLNLNFPHFTLSFQNLGLHVADEGDLSAAILCPNVFGIDRAIAPPTPIPDGRKLYHLPNIPKLLPDAFHSITVTVLRFDDDDLSLEEEYALSLRLFTVDGRRDFHIVLTLAV